MSVLLVDAGNTRVKWAFAGADGLVAPGAVAHGEAGWIERLEDAWRAHAPVRIAWLASVAQPEVEAALLALLARVAPVERVRSTGRLAGVRNGYLEPQRLGVDRLLAMAGAQAMSLAPALVVGVGTAATIDALAGDGTHCGGLILPSPRAMQAAVLAQTPVRPRHEGRVTAFARSTEDALASGAWLALAACVERSADTFARESSRATGIVLHGGAAPALAGLLERAHVVREHLVLEGLAAVAADAVR